MIKINKDYKKSLKHCQLLIPWKTILLLNIIILAQIIIPKSHAACTSQMIEVNCPDSIAIISPAQIIEGDESFKAIVCSSKSYTSNISISLFSYDRSEIICPQTAFLASGYTWTYINMKVVDDFIADGPIELTISAEFEGVTKYTKIIVNDNDHVSDESIEKQALSDLYTETSGDFWKNNSDWLTTGVNPCSWHGIECDNGVMPVSEIQLNDQNLTGILPSSLGNFLDLKRLFLGQNQLKGSIPASLQNTCLHSLWLQGNSFSGKIPDALCELSFLQELNLSSNSLSGSLPSNIGKLIRLSQMNLSKNQFSGTLPESFGQLIKITELDMHDNNFSGAVDVISELCKLKKLDISNNQFNNKLSNANLSTLPDLRILDLYTNEFTGNFPYLMAQNTNLLRIDIHDTHLSGQLPQWESSGYLLNTLNLKSNNLQGEIPETIVRLTRLSQGYLDLTWNALYTNNQTVKDFIDKYHVGTDWEKTQTTMPSDITATVLSSSAIRFEWTPIVFTSYTGAYEIHSSYSLDLPFFKTAETSSKIEQCYTITDLLRNTDYYFKIRTRTDPHENNRNVVYSEFSPPIHLTTHSTVLTIAGENGQISPSGLISVPQNQTIVFSIIPDYGYHVSDVFIDSKSVGSVASYTFNTVMYPRKIEAFFGNENPLLFPIDPIVFDEDIVPPPVPLSITDRETLLDDLNITATSQNIELVPDNNLSIVNNGSNKGLLIKPAQEMSGFGTITVKVSDPQGLSASQIFNYTVNIINDPPVVKNLVYTAYEDKEIDCLFMGLDVEDDAMFYVITAKPNHGKITHDLESDSFLYRADADYFGRDYIKYKANDRSDLGSKSSGEATIIMNVLPVNDAPLAIAGEDIYAKEGDIINLNGSKSRDIDMDNIKFLWTQTLGPSVELSDPQAISPIFITPHASPDGSPISLIFWLSVTDEPGLTSYDDCTVWVEPKDSKILPLAQIASPVSPVSGIAPLMVNFIDQSIGEISDWKWSFGDNRSSIRQHTVYTYDLPGSYTITLLVAGAGGSDMISKTNWIHVLPNPDSITPVIQSAEREALVDLYNNTSGSNWLWNTNWLQPTGTEYIWYGVVVPEDIKHVKKLLLSNNNLDGFLPPNLNQLKYLEQIDFSKNKVFGSFPDNLTELTSLTRLDISNNKIKDHISGNYNRLTKLRYLNLSDNQFYGSIPEAISQLSFLTELYLNHNKLIGSLPPSFANLTNLLNLSLASNKLDGPIPDFIDQMTSLQRIDLSKNQFIGQIPDSLMRATKLRGIRISQNKIDGTIPDGFEKFEKLQELDLSFNQLTGSFNDTLYECQQLMDLNLSNNQLDGPLKTRITLLKQLTQLDISYNNFTGFIPIELTRLFRLTNLNLSHNGFGGEIPVLLSKLLLLKELDISHNHFIGSFPEIFLNLSLLESINIAGNNFYGQLPVEIRQMTWLKDNGSDFRWNCFTVPNRTTEKFISTKQVSGESWIDTQTIAPSEIKSKEGSSYRELVLSWEPIAYTADSGGYEIYISQDIANPFELLYVTHSKMETAYTVTGLKVNKTYYFKIRTVTYPHMNNPNTLYSEYTDILPVTVYELTTRPKTPGNLQVETYYNNRVMLTWSLQTTPSDIYYHVYRCETLDGIFQKLTYNPLTENTFIDYNVYPGKNYYYKVRSYSGETASEFYSEIAHAVPGEPTTYSIEGHFTQAIIEQGETAVYSLTLKAAEGFTGRVKAECLWPGEDPTVWPTGIDQMFYLNGYEMDTKLKSAVLPAQIRLELSTSKDYTPSVLFFKLQLTDSKTKDPRIFDMELHILQKNECGIIVKTDKPVYYLFSDIGISGFISERVSGEPVDIIYWEGDIIRAQSSVKTRSDGYFETMLPPSVNIPISYSVTATWNVWNEDQAFCNDSKYSTEIPLEIQPGITRFKINMFENQRIPVVGTYLKLQGELFTDTVPFPEVIIRIHEPGGTFTDKVIGGSPGGNYYFDISNIFLSKKGLWRIKGYGVEGDGFSGCESEFFELLVETPPGRAIILGSSYPEYQIKLPYTTHKVCKKVYDQLILRGFDPVEIYSMMHLPVDNPLDPPAPTLENMGWVSKMNPTSEEFIEILKNEFQDVLAEHVPLWLYIHGFADSKTQIQMAGFYDFVTAEQIDSALDSLQAASNCPVIIIIDTPYSGAFIKQLVGRNRIIITSTDSTNYAVDQDYDINFSLKFFEYLNKGENIYQSFINAKKSWDEFAKASAQMETNGDGIINSYDNYNAIKTFMNGPVIQFNPPVIEDVTIRKELNYATSLPVSVKVSAGTNPIDRVKLKVLNSSNHPVYKDISTEADFITYDLLPTFEPGLYTALLTCLTQAGTYTLIVVAKDRHEHCSEPEYLTIVSNPETPVNYFENIKETTRHTLDAMCGFFTDSDSDSGFHVVTTPTEKSLRGIWGLNHQHVYAVGDAGIILKFDGSEWLNMESNTQERLLDVWGSAANNVYAVGENGTIQHFNGNIWKTVDSQIQNPLTGIWGTADNNIYAVGGHGTILHYDGTAWTRHYTKWYDRLNDIWGRNKTDIYVAGENGILLHFDGNNWDALPFCYQMPVDLIIGDEENVFNIHFFDSIKFDQGNGWAPTKKCNYKEMNDYWQSIGGHVFTVGEKGRTIIWSPPPSCETQNSSPTISPISDREIAIYQKVPPIPFTVKDAESFPYELFIRILSSNPDLVDSNQVSIQGTGANRFLIVTPKFGTIGETYLSIVVEDTCGSMQADGFLLKIYDNYGSPNNGSEIPGDYDKNGKISMEDILEIMRKLSEYKTLAQ